MDVGHLIVQAAKSRFGEDFHYKVKATRLRRLAARWAASGPGVRLSGRSRPAPPAH